MLWRDNRRNKTDASQGDGAAEQDTAINWNIHPAESPDSGISFEGTQPPPRLSRQEFWDQLGERAWEILERRRMGAIWPCEAISEFQRYRDLLRRSPSYGDEVLVGLRLVDAAQNIMPPLFVPRRVFTRHAYILGGTGSGKTSYAAAQLLLQLAEPYDWREHQRSAGNDSTAQAHAERAPILIIDMKQNGDRYLRAVARQVAEDRGQQLQFFSDNPNYVSLQFDPFYCLRTIEYPLKRLETLLKAFSLIYPEGYGSDFFTNEQRVQLLEILYGSDRPATLRQLIQCVRNATRGPGGNKDARGLYGVLASLEHAIHLHTDDSPIDPDQRVDFDRFFARGEVLYVHLDSRANTLLSRDIGKLLLFSLLETAAQREARGEKKQTFVFIDEFHRLAARNVVEMLEDARSAGIGFILAHQSSSSLQTRDGDLYGILFENCSFKQCLTLEDPRVVELFRLISGRTAETREGGSTAQTDGMEWSRSWSRGSSESSTFEPGWIWDTLKTKTRGTTGGESVGKSGSRGTAKTTSWNQEMVCSLTPEMIQDVNERNLLSLVHIKGVGRTPHNPAGGGPLLVQGMYPYTEPEADALEKEPWPTRQVKEEEYYRFARPEIPEEAVREVQSARTGTRSNPRPRNEGQQRLLEEKVRQLAKRLTSQMIREASTVERFARSHHLSTKQTLELANALGLNLSKREDLIPPREADQMEQLLREAGDAKKDNGPR